MILAFMWRGLCRSRSLIARIILTAFLLVWLIPSFAFAATGGVAGQLRSLAGVIPAQMLQTVLVLMGLIALDTVLGWISALAKGQFHWHQVARFLETSILPYVGGLLALAAVGLLEPVALAGFYGSAAVASAKFLADIFQKISALGISVQQPSKPTPSPNKPA
jgi:hypothetical protein